MPRLSAVDLTFIEETLKSAQLELETLSRDKEWFCSDCLEMVETSLQIIKTTKEET